ncbi:MAG: aminoacyl-tRNA hydrolase [Alphaproteobacteria bacterium]|nr:aminoacyl-tRNA hydrolase [Alphaproteobacteria bacterium]
MHLIVGLGNPGVEHAHNRHNIGFMAVDAIARAHGFAPFRAKFNGLVSDGTIGGERILLLKPQTYMNRSGDSVGQAVKFYKLAPEDVTVIYDELDLVPGKLRVKTGGGNGGHNGLRSIDPVIGTAYQRVRLGIGHPGHKDLVTRHVLGDFARSDAEWREDLLGAIAANAGLLAIRDAGNFMNRVALAMPGEPEPPKPPRQEKPKADTSAESAPSPAEPPEQADTPALKGGSHIRQARPKPAPDLPKSGPMADMLKKLFGHKN